MASVGIGRLPALTDPARESSSVATPTPAPAGPVRESEPWSSPRAWRTRERAETVECLGKPLPGVDYGERLIPVVRAGPVLQAKSVKQALSRVRWPIAQRKLRIADHGVRIRTRSRAPASRVPTMDEQSEASRCAFPVAPASRYRASGECLPSVMPVATTSLHR